MSHNRDSEMNNKATPKQEVIEFLGGLADGSTKPAYGGICYALWKEFRGDIGQIPDFFCSGWEEWSGDIDFPVPYPEYGAEQGFYFSKGKYWESEYGASRKRFCLYLVEQLKLMSDEDFEKEFCEGAGR